MNNEELVSLIQKGIDRDKNLGQLYSQNINLLQAIVRQVYTGKEQEEDLLQECYFGLVSAVDHYDPAKGAKFMSYANLWIKTQIVRYLHNCGNPVRIPEWRMALIRSFNRIQSQFEMENGRKPSRSETAGLLGITIEDVDQLRTDMLTMTMDSLERPIDEGEDLILADMVPSIEDEQAKIIDRIYDQELRESLWKEVDSLGANDSRIMRSYYQEGKTMAEIGKTIGVERWKIRGVIAEDLNRLRRKATIKQFMDDYAFVSAIKSVSVSAFNRSWTSATEMTAIRLMEMQQ